MMKAKKKVFVGPSDVGTNQFFKNLMQSYGYKITTCSFADMSKFGWKNDIELKIDPRQSLAKRLPMGLVKILCNFPKSLGYDLYHFRFGRSLLPLNIDLPLLKLLSKKIIMNFQGSDIRQLDRFQKDKYNHLMVKEVNYNRFKEAKKRLHFAWLKFWVDKFIVSTPDLLEFVPNAEYVPNFAPDSLYSIVGKKDYKTVYILHAPSKRKIKGTRYIVSAIKRLRKEGLPIKLLLLENISHDKIICSYQKADIVVDQLLIGWYGKVSIEGMLFSKPIVCYIRKDLLKYSQKLPVISANPDNIYEVLKYLVVNKEKRQNIGRKSFKFVNKYLNEKDLGNRWEKIYKKLLKK